MELEVGKFFPDGDGVNHADTDYAQAIATALGRDVGATHQAAKRPPCDGPEPISELSRTGWQRYGQCGRHLIDLMRHSDVVLDAALRLAGRTETIAATSLAEGNSWILIGDGDDGQASGVVRLRSGVGVKRRR